MKLLRPKFSSLKTLLWSALIMLSFTAGWSQIKKRTLPDGTIEYYNDSSPSSSGTHAAVLSSRYDHIIIPVCNELSLDPHLIRCIIKVESGFNPDAVSEAGAMGLMQLMQETARHYGVRNPFDPAENIRAGCRHFKAMMTHFKNDIQLSLAAYHAGLGAVKRRMAIPPIKSTINYVSAVMKLYNGNTADTGRIRRLYQKIDREGTIIIYDR